MYKTNDEYDRLEKFCKINIAIHIIGTKRAELGRLSPICAYPPPSIQPASFFKLEILVGANTLSVYL